MKEKLQKILDITFWKFVLVGIINTLVGTDGDVCWHIIFCISATGCLRHPIMWWEVL